MGRRALACILACAVSLLAVPAQVQEGRAKEGQTAGWATVPGPASGPVAVHGAHGLGCLAGAEALPPEGSGWQAVRLSRNRIWGHPDLIAALRGLAGQAQAAGLPDLLIGDLGQPRGGPMPWGHASHQIGLDADVWLDLRPRPPLSRQAREAIEVPSVVRPDGLAVDPARFTGAHALLLRLAAGQPGVDRIFVHPAIKQALCQAHPGAGWLRRIRPWRGHDSHIHIRLRCPADQPGCRDQAPPPPGDGCDASLAWWFTSEARQPPAPPAAPPPAVPSLPAACAAVLAAP